MTALRTPLDSNDVHIWLVHLDTSWSYDEGFSQHLSDDEQDRAKRFHFDRHRRRFIVSHGALRQILAGYLGIEPADISYTKASHGKPCLSGSHQEAGIFFNLSHSHELAIIAVTGIGEIGVDVEYIQRFRNIDGIAARFFSAAEQAVYKDLVDEFKVLGFYNCWTRKEAFIKALGEGLSHPLKQFDVSLSPSDQPTFLRIGNDHNEASQWTLEALDCGTDYAGAVALRAQGILVTQFEFGKDKSQTNPLED
jgi:4'-phosphopantetheinyl transferase